MFSFIRSFRKIDADNDGFPDSCDYCLGGDDRILNGRGIPQMCDAEKGTLQESCTSKKGSFNKEIPQCVIK